MAITPNDKKISELQNVAAALGMFLPAVDLSQPDPENQNVRVTIQSLLSLANLSSYVPTSRIVGTTGSLTGGGNLSADRSLSLVNDNAAPGASTYYGTNGAGTKGFFALPAPGTGTVTNVSAGNLPPVFTTNVANPTTTPSITFSLTNQNASTVFAGPAGGGPSVPAFRTLVATDIPNLSSLYQPLSANLTQIAALPDPGADRILFWDDSAGTFTYLQTGTGLAITGTTLDATGGGGTVTNFTAGNLAPLFTTNVATPTTTPALTFSLSNAAQNTVLAGPTAGAGAPTYRLLVAADIPNLSGIYQPLDADLTALAALATMGLVTRTGAGTFTTRAIAVGTNISVSNGDGVAGNPTLSVPDSSEVLRGAIELATQVETNTGTDDLRAVTPLKLKTFTDATYQPLDADLTALAALAGTGFAARTAANAWALRTITAGTNVSVSNGDGVAGNPSIAVPDSSEILRGAIEIATQVETDTGTDDLRAVTPLKLKTTTFASAKILVDRLAGSTYSTLQDYINTMTSPGTITGGELSTISGTQVRVAAGTGMVRIADDNISSLPFFNWAQTDFTVPNDDNPRYFGVVYNAGTPVVQMRTAFNWDFDTEIPLGAAIRNTASTIFVFVNRPYRTGDAMTNVIQRFDSIAPVQRDNDVGGLLISETGTRNIAVTAGKIWLRLNDFNQAAINTSTGSTMITAFYNGTSWVYTPGVTQWPNTQFNNIASGLVNITGNRYVNLWFYLGASGGGLRMVYGQAQYVQLADALAESEPVFFPTNLHPFLLLIGKLTFQNGGATATSLVSPFTGANLGGSGGGAVTTHNQLSGLQGGTTNEYYHLTQAAYNNISAGTTATPTFADITSPIGVASQNTGRFTTLYAGPPTGSGGTVSQVNGLDVPLPNTAGIFSVGSTDAAAADKGGSIGFTANTTTLAGYPMGSISARYAATGAGVYASYMAFATTDVVGVVAERMRLTTTGINNTAIGSTTRSTGAFTTLATSGDIDSAGEVILTRSLPAVRFRGTEGSARNATLYENAGIFRIAEESVADRFRFDIGTGNFEALGGINSTTIGAITPSTGSFTTLTVNGKAVTEGAADSGGTGFRLLRVPN